MRQYSIKNMRPGYKQCLFCLREMPTGLICDCSLKIKLEGDYDNVKAMFSYMASKFDIVYYDHWENGDSPNFSKQKKTHEAYIWLAIRPPL